MTPQKNTGSEQERPKAKKIEQERPGTEKPPRSTPIEVPGRPDKDRDDNRRTPYMPGGANPEDRIVDNANAGEVDAGDFTPEDSEPGDFTPDEAPEMEAPETQLPGTEASSRPGAINTPYDDDDMSRDTNLGS